LMVSIRFSVFSFQFGQTVKSQKHLCPPSRLTAIRLDLD
jgi:hypothetical protein